MIRTENLPELMETDTPNDLSSLVVRAGRRSYFFDVKATKGKDLFLSITESKRISHDDEEPRYEKHKIFLYKEDFEAFVEALQSSLKFIESKQGCDGYRSAESVRISKNNSKGSE
ncbi:MAG TPA: DUF3276 family protein [Flavobacteriales bacterium]